MAICSRCGGQFKDELMHRDAAGNLVCRLCAGRVRKAERRQRPWSRKGLVAALGVSALVGAVLAFWPRGGRPAGSACPTPDAAASASPSVQPVGPEPVQENKNPKPAPSVQSFPPAEAMKIARLLDVPDALWSKFPGLGDKWINAPAGTGLVPVKLELRNPIDSPGIANIRFFLRTLPLAPEVSELIGKASELKKKLDALEILPRTPAVVARIAEVETQLEFAENEWRKKANVYPSHIFRVLGTAEDDLKFAPTQAEMRLLPREKAEFWLVFRVPITARMCIIFDPELPSAVKFRVRPG